MTIRKIRPNKWRGYRGGVRVIEFRNTSTETAEEAAKKWLADPVTPTPVAPMGASASENQKQDMASEPKTVHIDVSDVPEGKRNDPRFLSLLASMQKGCANPRLVHAISIHEAAHVFFLGNAGATEPTACGPKILYDATKDEFNGQGSTVKFNSMDKDYIAKIDTREWLGRAAKGYAAGGVAARLLAGSVDKGDGDDRDNFDAMFNKVKADNPKMTWTSDSLWALAQDAVTKDLQNSEIRGRILECAEGLKAELFRVS
jgi:hypothetical protein